MSTLLQKVSLDLTIESSQKRYIEVRNGIGSFQACNFQRSREAWCFEPVSDVDWGTNGTPITNNLTLQGYDFSSDRQLLNDAPHLTYDLYFFEAGTYDLWVYGYSAGQVYWGLDGDTTHLRPLVFECSEYDEYCNQKPYWQKFGTIYLTDGGVHSFSVYLGDLAEVVLDQWYFTSNEDFQDDLDLEGEEAYRQALPLSPGPFMTVLSVTAGTEYNPQMATSWLSSVKMPDSGIYNYGIYGTQTELGIEYEDSIALSFWQVGGDLDNYAAWNYVVSNGEIVYSYSLFGPSSTEVEYEYQESCEITTVPPTQSSLLTNSFCDGQHFRTACDADPGPLSLDLDNKLLGLVFDESGSNTWNDAEGDRYTLAKEILSRLNAVYPSNISVSVIGFGGTPTKTRLMVAASSEDIEDQQFEAFLQERFEDSSYDFAGTRVVRRTDRFPTHPSDGAIVVDGLVEAGKDEDLTTGTTHYYGIWTYNRDRNYSSGRFLSVTPRSGSTPQGVNFASGMPRLLPGILRDDYTRLLYNLQEGSGYVVYDSSGQGNHGTITAESEEHSFWAGDAATVSQAGNDILKRPVGVRFNGNSDGITTDPDVNFTADGAAGTRSVTINFWIFAYEQQDPVVVIANTTGAVGQAVGPGWGIREDGNLGWTTALSALWDDFAFDTGIAIPLRTWTMVTLIHDGPNNQIRVHINGNETPDYTIGGLGVDAAIYHYIEIGGKISLTGSGHWDETGWFYGSLAQISISNTVRTPAYIAALYQTESPIFDQSLDTTHQDPPDNTQREVLLSWEVAEDYDFTNGDIVIVRKYGEKPSHVQDGTLVDTIDAEPGQFFYIDAFDFTNGSRYYYALYSRNSAGSYCHRDEARIIPVHIPYSLNTDTTSTPSPVTNFTVTASSKKLMLQWDNPTDSTWSGVRVYYKTTASPSVKLLQSGETQTDGILLVDTTNEQFAHRTAGKSASGTDIPLVNGQIYYYSVVTYNRYGVLSSEVTSYGIPTSSTDLAFQPDEVRDLHFTVLNPETISIQWDNPTVRSDQLDLFFGEAAIIYVSVRDFYGAALQDVTNLKLQVCSESEYRTIITNEEPLTGGSALTQDDPVQRSYLDNFGFDFDDDCANDEATQETVLNYATVESGLVKGVLTHTLDRLTLARRLKYMMNVRAQYKVVDAETEDGDTLFEFNSKPIRVVFHHPTSMTMINLLNKYVDNREYNEISGEQACTESTEDEADQTQNSEINGGFVGATQPYICRIEVQYRGEALPDGTPVQVYLYKHGTANVNDPSFRTKPDYTSIEEGDYSTTAVSDPVLDNEGQPTGEVVSKSYVDVEIKHPTEPENIDVYTSINYDGFFVDAIHEVNFIGNVVIETDINSPYPDGIDVTEQFATVYTINPDNPNERTPVPDGTIVEWELEQRRFAPDRPFYSTDEITQFQPGVFSTTEGGLARSCFFGPVGNLQNHWVIMRTEGGGQEPCCFAEEYAITAKVTYQGQTAKSGEIFYYNCKSAIPTTNQRFLMSAAPGQQREFPHWLAWGDGESLVQFQIAQNPATSTMAYASCFRSCIEQLVGGQFFPLPEGHIVQIIPPVADCEIIWNAVFDEDEYTGTRTLLSYDSMSQDKAELLGVPFIANIPITGETTDFYIRANRQVSTDPHEDDCKNAEGSQFTIGDDDVVLACEWESICKDVNGCIEGGRKWVGDIFPLSGQTTLILNNKEATLIGGGDYDNGIPPIYVGFIEPLYLWLREVRINGERVEVETGENGATYHYQFDGVSLHTFVLEARFAGQPLPEGVPITINIANNTGLAAGPAGEDAVVVSLSTCENTSSVCYSADGGIAYTRLVNDPLINPTGNERSLIYFTIDPLPNLTFSSVITASCTYDKLGTVDRLKTVDINIAHEVDPFAGEGGETGEDGGGGAGGEGGDDGNDVNPTIPAEHIIMDPANGGSYSRGPACYRARMGAFAASVSESGGQVYLFGGYSGEDNAFIEGITPISEVLNLTSDTWGFTSDMPTPRAFGMTAVSGNHIYCIGGVQKNEFGYVLEVSREIEVYDALSETWNSSLTQMPSGYGVAFGEAFVSDDYIYVFCGVNSITSELQANRLNDVILRYSISTDTWTTIYPTPSTEYARVSSFGFIKPDPTNEYGDANCYIWGGSKPKTQAQINAEATAEIQRQLRELESWLASSKYYQNLTRSEQESYLSDKIDDIKNSIQISPFVYLGTGFRCLLGSEYLDGSDLYLDISTRTDGLWDTIPEPRDRGGCVYIPSYDQTYFIGGSNQNYSTTLDTVENVDVSTGEYSPMNPLPLGISSMACVVVGDLIYIFGGLTSGHRSGLGWGSGRALVAGKKYVQINVLQVPDEIEALGRESSGISISLTDDSGDPIEDDVKVIVTGRLRIPEIDDLLVEFLAERAADRILGGDGSGNAPDLPGDGSSDISDYAVERAQNKVTDPNSDQFQFNSARKLSEEVLIFPVIYTQRETTVSDGVATVSLLPRSEDPLDDLRKLSSWINDLLNNTPQDPDERYQGDLTREELAALGDVLATIDIEPTVIQSGKLRELYKVETIVTIVDEKYFGQTVSDLDVEQYNAIQDKIAELLTGQAQGTTEEEDDYDGSGQDNTSSALIPSRTQVRRQESTVYGIYYNVVDWIPQVKNRLVSNDATLADAIDEIDIMRFEIPFGASQSYDALYAMGRLMADETFTDLGKMIYVFSDGATNLPLVTRTTAIEEINSVNGDRQTPVLYMVVSTSYPLTLAAQFERAQLGDVETIIKETGGQSFVLSSSDYVLDMANHALGSTVGGLGYGYYKDRITLSELTAITSAIVDFTLPSNTNAYVRFRFSEDGYNFSDWTAKYYGSRTVQFANRLARVIDYEVVLLTGFVEDSNDPYYAATGSPQLNSITWVTSGERDDYIFLRPVEVLTNAQQVAAAFEGDIPETSIIEIGVATSHSHDWRDFQSPARPALREYGRTVLLNRTDSDDYTVRLESLSTSDGWTYRAEYGSWNPTSQVLVFEVDSSGDETAVTTSFKANAREGTIKFAERQPLTKNFRVQITDDDLMRVGVRLRNRFHDETITMKGLGFVYSTNDVQPPELSQVAPRATGVHVTPQNPNAGDTFMAVYTYVDLNNNPEVGSLIYWYKNGIRLKELDNKSSWDSSDLLPTNTILVGDSINYVLRPSDGREYGSPTTSPAVTIVAREPSVDDIRIVPYYNDELNKRYDTSSTFVAEYDFQNEDVGINSIEYRTSIEWYVNGSLFLTQIYSPSELTEDQDEVDFRSLSPDEGAHVIGNQIFYKVTPRTRLIEGNQMQSQTITVVNTIPVISNVTIAPDPATPGSTLQLSYTISDRDVEEGTQDNLTEIKWYESLNGRDFTERTQLQGQTEVPASYLVEGRYWRAELTPYDGLDVGVAVRSSTTVIHSL